VREKVATLCARCRTARSCPTWTTIFSARSAPRPSCHPRGRPAGAKPPVLDALSHTHLTEAIAPACDRHIFCESCIHTWVVERADAAACPACRSPITAESLVPDRLAAALIDNLPCYCQLRGAGCTWTGRHGDVGAHLASACPFVTLTCPGCSLELPRHEMSEHRASVCPMSAARECPYGCGERLAGAERMAEHCAVCLMEPRKLLAALGHMQRENQRLANENLQLRAAEQGSLRVRRRRCAALTAPPSRERLYRRPLRPPCDSQASEAMAPSLGPPSAQWPARAAAHGPGVC
jgi:hypothetical protein